MALHRVFRTANYQTDTGNRRYTFEQRFFWSYATIGALKHRNEALIDQLRTGNHSPARYRVLGPLAAVSGFAEAFNCPAGAPMMRAPAEQIATLVIRPSRPASAACLSARASRG